MVGGIRTHFTESGDDGPVIVALHGGGHGSSGASCVGRLFELLGGRYRVIGLDSIGGFGETEPIPLRYGLQSRVDHLAAFLDTLCLDRITIMGNSQGAWCAARYAIQHPDRVENVVLLSSGSIATAMGLKRPPVEQLKAYDGTRAGMIGWLRPLIAHPERITDEMIDLRVQLAARPGVREATILSDEAIRRVQQDPLLFAQFDLRTTLPALAKQIPTIFIWGDADDFAPPALGRELEALLHDVTFHWVPDAGHQIQTDQPEIVAQIIARFMDAPKVEVEVPKDRKQTT